MGVSPSATKQDTCVAIPANMGCSKENGTTRGITKNFNKHIVQITNNTTKYKFFPFLNIYSI